MTDDSQVSAVPDFKDRKAGLVVFGIIQILFGAFCLLMVPLMMLGMYAASTQNAGTAAPANAQVIPAALTYVVLSVWSIWMGIGSIQARRWARALLLITSWFVLVSGILGIIFMLVFLPDLYDRMGKNGQMPEQVAAVMKYVMTVFMVVFYIIIPGAFVLFYGSRHVKATCERRDPCVRWTDKCPLPVLAVSLITGLWCVCMPIMGVYRWAIPFFGVILTGVTGALVCLTIVALFGYMAWGFYRLNMRAWWCAVIMVVVWGVSSAITFSRVSVMGLYASMGIDSKQLEMMKPFADSIESFAFPMCVVWMIVAIGYLLYIRKYMVGREYGSPTGPAIPDVEPSQPPALPPALPQHAEAPSGGLAIASLVLGILAVLLGIFMIGGVLGIVGVILGVIHLVRSRARRSLAGWGIGLSVVGCLLAIAVPVLCVIFAKSMPPITPHQRYTQAVKTLSDPTTSELNRFYALNVAAKTAFNLGKRDEARGYVEEQSLMLERYKGDWNYGNAVQDINIVLGRLAVSEGDLDKAKEHLLKAGDSPGSPQMNSFGPNMSLAKDLLEKGEKQVVLEYFKKCGKFWKMDYGKLAAWSKQVEAGRVPEFGANLVY